MTGTMQRAGRRAVAWLLVLALVLGGGISWPSSAGQPAADGLYTAADICASGSSQHQDDHDRCLLHCLAASSQAGLLPWNAPDPSGPRQIEAAVLSSPEHQIDFGAAIPDARRARAPPPSGPSI